MRAECGQCGGTMNRTCKGAMSGQGRPLGKLAAWLAWDCGGFQEAHSGMQHPSEEDRTLHRARVEALPGNHDWIEAERRKNEVLDNMVTGEPRRIP